MALLAVYVALSLLARSSRRFRWLWRDPDEAPTGEHFFVYTLVPLLVFAAAAAAVVSHWDPSVPLHGGWSLRELVLGPTAAFFGLVLVVGGQLAGRGSETADASRPSSWLPLVAILAGIALLAYGVTTFGRTVKRSAPAGLRSP